MSTSIIQRLEELVTAGAQLVPLGGFDYSGYNARLQNKYVEWRKACLETFEQAGPIAVPYKSKVIGDQNGGYFYQSSAQLIHNCAKELYEKLKSSPELATAGPSGATSAAEPASPPATSVGGARVLKPPPKKTAAAAPAQGAAAATGPSNGGVGKKVYVIGEENDPLRVQLGEFLNDIGLEEILVKRVHGQMLDLDAFKHVPDIRYAFFVFNSEDLAYAMFELGHFVGQLGKGMVTVLHMSDVAFPKNVPGVTVKPIVVKLEETSLAIMKELKGAGYKMSF
jgi:hypothetical protein